jgi:hypothetical protein
MNRPQSHLAGLAVLAVVLTDLSFAPRAASAAGSPLARRWHLEFRILANEKDEPKALSAAKKYFAQAQKDAKRKAELRQLAREGKPPAPLAVATDKAPGYTWMELGAAELRSLQLDNPSARDPKRNVLWKMVAAARDKGEALRVTYGMYSTLLYSRPCQNTMLSAKERAAKKYDYFLLTRDPEKGKAITGQHLVRAEPLPEEEPLRIKGLDPIYNRGVKIELSKEGGDLLFQLTSKNLPEEEGRYKRHLAVILDGRIVVTPSLNGPIRRKAQITGGTFTKEDVKSLVETLQRDMAKGKKK